MTIRYCGMESKTEWRVTAVRAKITTRESGLGEHDQAACATWMGLKSPRRDDVWLQLGYAHETRDDRYIAYMEAALDEGTCSLGPVDVNKAYEFRIERNKNTGQWWFYIDNQPQGFSDHPAQWRPNEFLDIQFYGEEQHKSTMAGDENTPTLFDDCQIRVAFGDWRDVDFRSNYIARVDDVWNHLTVTGPDSFEIYSE